jgi:3-isopropylmalate/(R)-2-methylmalate dehydratase small subunit
LEDYGFRAIIAPSFADIFYNNCFKNGLLPIVQDNDVMDELFAFSDEITIDLEMQTILAKNSRQNPSV